MFGAERSTLGPIVAKAVGGAWASTLSPDPDPPEEASSCDRTIIASSSRASVGVPVAGPGGAGQGGVRGFHGAPLSPAVGRLIAADRLGQGMPLRRRQLRDRARDRRWRRAAALEQGRFLRRCSTTAMAPISDAAAADLRPRLYRARARRAAGARRLAGRSARRRDGRAGTHRVRRRDRGARGDRARRRTSCRRCRPRARPIRCSRAMARCSRQRRAGSAISPRPASMAIPAAHGSTRARRPAAAGAARAPPPMPHGWRSARACSACPASTAPAARRSIASRAGRAHRDRRAGPGVQPRPCRRYRRGRDRRRSTRPPGAYNLADDLPARQNDGDRLCRAAARAAMPPPFVALDTPVADGARLLCGEPAGRERQGEARARLAPALSRLSRSGLRALKRDDQPDHRQHRARRRPASDQR